MIRLRHGLLWALLATCATTIAVHAALVTPLGANPDEWAHLDAFQWYSESPVTPPLDSDGIFYSPYGNSRVYSTEIVYPLFGRLGATWRALTGSAPPPRLFRLANVALLALLLVILRAPRARSPLDMPRAAMLIAGVPQLFAVFSAANSDGFAILSATALIAAAIRELDDPSPSRWPFLGALAGIVLLSKTSAWVALPLALGLCAMAWRRVGWRGGTATAAAMTMAFVLFLPALAARRLAEPSGWHTAVESMREHRAHPEWRPSSPRAEGYRLASRGVSLRAVVLSPIWWRRSCASLWGVFGAMSVRAPTLALAAAFVLWLVLGAANVACLLRPDSARRVIGVVVASSAATFALAVLGSLLHSWLVDFQPQGRYLLPAILPLAITLVGAPCRPGSRPERVRVALIAALLALGWCLGWWLPEVVAASTAMA